MKRKTFTEDERHLIFGRDGYTCQSCGTTHRASNLHVDHIIPVSRGGSNDFDNLQTLCVDCNLEKSNLTMDEYQSWKAEQEANPAIDTGILGAIIGGTLFGLPGAVLGGILGYQLGQEKDE